MKAMLSAASMLGMGLGSLSSMPPMWGSNRGVRMRSRTPGRTHSAGAKLWRKAREGKLGVRW